MAEKIWVGITAHDPMSRLSTLLLVVSQYEKFVEDVSIKVYIDYDSQEVADDLHGFLSNFNLEIEVVVCSPDFKGYALCWAHKLDFAMSAFNQEFDYYIYQENDMVLTRDNFNYWRSWYKRLEPLGLEPGFIRYELYEGSKIPFDNYLVHSLTKTTPNVWTNEGFKPLNVLCVDHEIDFFTQAANPYYGAMILSSEKAKEYLFTDAFDMHKSYQYVGKRNWPLADRSSMGLTFYPPEGAEHRRSIPITKKGDSFLPKPECLIEHRSNRYSKELAEKAHEPLLTTDNIFTVP